MTRPELVKWRGLMQAACAAAALARAARRAGDKVAFQNQAHDAERLYEDARIARGDKDVLLQRADRWVEQALERERWLEQTRELCRREAQREVLQAGLLALGGKGTAPLPERFKTKRAA
ncbi:MAG: hypothetical protein OSA97_06805 [Nevskia sp.]|nr:hypothetical protein [Nevskia sp.]